jgi:F0F1-type ATP synthase delta subunit
MKQAYITALTDSLLATENVDEVLVRTEALLAQKGHTRLWPAVLRGVVVELEKRVIDETPEVTVAKEGGLDKAKLAEVLAALKVQTEVVKTVVDPSLIGGFTLQYRDTVVDKSYKRALLDIYRKVTK